MYIENILTKQFHIKDILKEPLVCFQNQSKIVVEMYTVHGMSNKGTGASALNL